MTWFKLDDQFHSHIKVIAAGNAAVGLYCRLGTYIADKLTDGFIPDAVARSMGKPRELKALVECPVPDTRPLLAKVDGGYLMVDYLEYNPTREKVLAERDAARDRMQKRRGRSKGVRPNEHPDDEGNDDRSSAPPVPVPPVTNSSYPPNTDTRGDEQGGGGESQGVTPAAIAAWAGTSYAQSQLSAGQNVTPSKLGPWKATQLTKEQPGTLARLAARANAYHAWSGEQIPRDVLAAAALGQAQSLSAYTETAPPEAEDTGPKLTAEERAALLAAGGSRLHRRAS